MHFFYETNYLQYDKHSYNTNIFIPDVNALNIIHANSFIRMTV